MPKHIRKTDGSGHLAGSIGDGKDILVPTASKISKSKRDEDSASKKNGYAPLEYYLQSWVQTSRGESMVGSFEHPEWAAGMCESASASFGSYLVEKGESAQVLNLRHKVLGAPHAVVLLGDTVIDWTYRQFDENADIPFISNIKDLEEVFTVLSSSDPEEDEEDDLFF